MARPFEFKLEKILEYRKQVEDQAKLALSLAKQAVQDQTTLVGKIEKDLLDCVTKMNGTKQMTQADLWLWSSWRKRLELDKRQAQARLVELKKLAEARRLELVARSKDRKLLEKLRANQAEKHAHEEQRKEQNQFDETATLRYGRTPY